MTIYYSQEARRNLIEIWTTLASLGSAGSADRHMMRIKAGVERLRTTPGIGISFQSKFGIDTDLQYIVVDKNYLVIYRRRPEAVAGISQGKGIPVQKTVF